MRLLLFILLLSATESIWSQNTIDLIGGWVTIASHNALGSSIESVNENYNKDYLKYTFSKGNMVDITSNYAANTNYQKYTLKNSTITLLFGRQFLIEKLNPSELVLVELENGKTNSKSIRYWFIREQSYLDKLPLTINDSIPINGTIAYLESKKLYPKFTSSKYPDFHLYMDAHIKSNYEEGENYYYASFVIHPSGEIDNIQILHHINKAHDSKVKRAIKKSEGMWIVPKLNGKEVRIVNAIEDRQIKTNQKNQLRFSPATFNRYSNEYVSNFHQLVQHIQHENYKKALEYISICEVLNRKEPNLVFLKMFCYEKLGDTKHANENRKLLEKLKLKYLL